MKKKEFENLPSKKTPLTAENLNEIQDNAEINKYSVTLDEDLPDNSEIIVPAYYKVGTNNLQVYFEGELLEKDVHYVEIGKIERISNKIQILDWGESVDRGYTFSFIIQGLYTVEEGS